MDAVTGHSDFRIQENKICYCFHFFPSICHEVMGLDAMILVSWVLSFKPTFSLSSFPFIKRLFSFSLLPAIRVVSSAYLRLLIFLLAILIPAYDSSSSHFTWCTLNVHHWKDWCWSWNSNTLATWCEELMHWKKPWCWERLKAGGEGDDRGWDGWIASSTQWTWAWVNSGNWWWTGKPGVLQSLGSQRVEHDWATELNWG